MDFYETHLIRVDSVSFMVPDFTIGARASSAIPAPNKSPISNKWSPSPGIFLVKAEIFHYFLLEKTGS